MYSLDTKSSILQYYQNLISDIDFRINEIKKWKDDGHRLIGYFSNYIPEEIILGAGYSPLRMVGFKEESSKNPMGLHPFSCMFVKNIFTLFNNYPEYLDLLDGMVFPNSCDSLRCLNEEILANYPSKKIRVLEHPLHFNPSSREFLPLKLKEMCEFLKNMTEIDLKENSLYNSIEIVNKMKELLGFLMHSSDVESLKPSEYVSIITANLLIPKDIGLPILQKLINLLKIDNTHKLSKEDPCISIIGPILGNLKLLQFIDEMNIRINPYDITNGQRYLESRVSLDGDPIENICKSMWSRIKSPTFSVDIARNNLMGNLIKDSTIKGALFIIPKDCEPYYFYYAAVKELFANNNKAVLLLEYDYSEERMETLKNRVAAFGEMIKK